VGRLDRAFEQTPAAGQKSAAAKPRGGSKAKRNDPRYVQALAYVNRDNHRKMMGKLKERGDEFSEVIDQFIADWLKANS
jgi:hypothetical protein